MKHLILFFLLFLGFLAVPLNAQPTLTDTLDLGGEDISTTMNDNGGLDQTVSNRDWWLAFLSADSIRVRPDVINFESLAYTSRNYERDPGDWVAYSDLNILYYLEDLEALQRHLFWRFYDNNNAEATSPAGGRRPSDIRSRPSAAANDRVVAPSGTANSFSTSGGPKANYPVVRQDVLGEQNIRKNPRYFKVIPDRNREADSSYRTTYNNSKALNRLYRAIFLDATSEYSYFYGAPKVIIHPKDENEEVHKTVLNVQLDVLAWIEQAMLAKYNQQPSVARVTKLNDQQVKALTPQMQDVPLPFHLYRILGVRRQQLNNHLPGIESSLAELETSYDKCQSFLSPAERSLFDWLIQQKTALVTWQTAAVNGMGTLLRSRAGGANYGQLMVIAEYLRLSEVSLTNLTKNPKIPYALQRVKQPYHDAVLAVEQVFLSKRD